MIAHFLDYEHVLLFRSLSFKINYSSSDDVTREHVQFSCDFNMLQNRIRNNYELIVFQCSCRMAALYLCTLSKKNLTSRVPYATVGRNSKSFASKSRAELLHFYSVFHEKTCTELILKILDLISASF